MEGIAIFLIVILNSSIAAFTEKSKRRFFLQPYSLSFNPSGNVHSMVMSFLRTATVDKVVDVSLKFSMSSGPFGRCPAIRRCQQRARGPDCDDCPDLQGHGERSRLQFPFQWAGIVTAVSDIWLGKFGCATEIFKGV